MTHAHVKRRRRGKEGAHCLESIVVVFIRHCFYLLEYTILLTDHKENGCCSLWMYHFGNIPPTPMRLNMDSHQHKIVGYRNRGVSCFVPCRDSSVSPGGMTGLAWSVHRYRMDGGDGLVGACQTRDLSTVLSTVPYTVSTEVRTRDCLCK